ncbi:MAG: FecR family protein [Mangrovibacterium sp.]
MNKMEKNKIWKEVAASLNQEAFDEEIAAQGGQDSAQIREIDFLLKKDRKLIDLLLKKDTAKAWAKLKSKKTNQGSFIKKMLACAAGAILLVASGYLLKAQLDNTPPAKESCIVFSVPNAEMGNVVLADGTRVFLNSASELKYAAGSENSREVFLKGEAYFEVKPDRKNPFLVHLNNFTIKVTGTQFNVRSYPDSNTEATLIEGEISILNQRGSELTKVKPNESIVFDQSTKKLILSCVNTSSKTEWRNGKIYLKNKTMEEIATSLERWYDVKFEFADESIKKVRLTGTILKNKPVEQILEILKMSEPIDFEYTYKDQLISAIKIKPMK